jgi:hypothetical protein
MGRELSTEPMRTPWHGVVATSGGERRLRAHCRERGHHVVTGLVAGGVGPVT